MVSLPSRDSTPSPTPASAEQLPSSASSSSAQNPVTTVALHGTQSSQGAATPLSQKSIQPILVSTIANEDNLTVLQNFLTQWHEIAQKLLAEAEGSQHPSGADIDKLQCSVIIVERLLKTLKTLPSTSVVFVSFDTNATLQTVAIADFSSSKGFKVSYIATHPENLAISNRQARFRGGGAAVMTAILAHAVALNAQGSVTVSAFSDAVGFYRKLGFTSHSSDGIVDRMSITPPAIQQTLQAQSNTIIQVHERRKRPSSPSTS